MRYYPVFLDINTKPCVVIGGGAVAERKVKGLLAAGASVTVISPAATKSLLGLASKGQIKFTKRRFRPGMLDGFFLAFAATGSKEVNEAVAAEAREMGIPVNAADDPAHCSFIMPAVVDRGALTVAISTSGKSPLFARLLREGLETIIGTEYETLVEILGAVRKKLLKRRLSHDKKESIIKDLLNSRLPEMIRAGDDRGINEALRNTAGEGYSLSRLGVKIKKI
ncbi:precorrin-2 dehydrogenase / sirohydrochlorin ferrochelatase [Anaerolineae bacterium]|nr:precorrin-2 dehydrogenase / sirohydrochlorin ferrochelatase [Anaerolineae bacterium]